MPGMIASLPWRHFTSWSHQWSVMPSFLVGEYVFIGLAVVALVHARACGCDHVLAWIAALVAGTANDLFFMALPLVDNFWQAQATIMLTPRLPLYIPCVYVCFMYLPKVAVWRLGLPRLSTAVATGLCAALFYAPYDIVGAKFLWWTWHDTDQPIANRILGAPIGSTMWVIAFVAAWSWLLDRFRGPDSHPSARTFVRTLGLVALLATPIMMLELTVLQQLDGGIPGSRGLVVIVILFVAIAARGWRRRVEAPRPAADRILRIALPVHFCMLAAILVAFDPATHVTTGVHQAYGPCHVPATDITGLRRYEFLCAEDFDEDFHFACAGGPPVEPAEWYTLCGRAFASTGARLRFTLAVVGLGAIGISLYAWLLRRRTRG